MSESEKEKNKLIGKCFKIPLNSGETSVAPFDDHNSLLFEMNRTRFKHAIALMYLRICMLVIALNMVQYFGRVIDGPSETCFPFCKIAPT